MPVGVFAVRRPIAKVCLLLGCAMIAFAAHAAWSSFTYRQKLDRWREQVLLDLPVSLNDLSEQSGVFSYTCTVAHGQIIKLAVYDQSNNPLSKFPRQVDYDCRLVSVSVPKSTIDLVYYGGMIGPGWMDDSDGLLLARGYPGPPGDYRLHFKLNKPIEIANAARAQLVVRNAFCGCEYLGPFFGNVIAGLSALLGMCFALPAGFRVFACTDQTPPGGLEPS